MNECDCCSADSAGTGEMACQVAAVRPDQPIPTCPVTGYKGKRIDTITVKAMLGVSLTALRDVDYFFCADSDCPVVYFSEDKTQTFTTADIRERVFQKERGADDVFVCYCFRHTSGDIREEFTATGDSTVPDRISAGIKAGQCSCDVRNPQGTCCLGNVNLVVKHLQSA